jgi:riboflavin synthase
MSLTIASMEADSMSVAVIPHTYRNSNLPSRRTGDRLNLECDVLAKYVEKLLGPRAKSSLTIEQLRELGY